MEKYLLIDEDDTTIKILEQVFANSYKEAQKHFDSQGWVIGEVKSEFDWNIELKNESELFDKMKDYFDDLKNECELNSLENQSNE